MELLQHAAAREAAAAPDGSGPSSSDARAPPGGGMRQDVASEDEKAELMARLRAICRNLDGDRREQIRENVGPDALAGAVGKRRE